MKDAASRPWDVVTDPGCRAGIRFYLSNPTRCWFDLDIYMYLDRDCLFAS